MVLIKFAELVFLIIKKASNPDTVNRRVLNIFRRLLLLSNALLFRQGNLKVIAKAFWGQLSRHSKQVIHASLIIAPSLIQRVGHLVSQTPQRLQALDGIILRRELRFRIL